MSNELIRPIDPESAKAVQETAKAFGKALDAVTGTGAYASSIFGRLPHDLVGIAGDQIFHVRRMRAITLDEEYRKLLRERRVEPIEVSPSVAIPLLEAAVDETREILKDLWVRLLANACDPNRQGRVRLSFIEVLKKFDPLDAQILQIIGETSGVLSPNARDFVVARLKVSPTEVLVSFENLVELGCLGRQGDGYPPNVHMNDRGRLILAAVAI